MTSRHLSSPVSNRNHSPAPLSEQSCLSNSSSSESCLFTRCTSAERREKKKSKFRLKVVISSRMDFNITQLGHYYEQRAASELILIDLNSPFKQSRTFSKRTLTILVMSSLGFVGCQMQCPAEQLISSSLFLRRSLRVSKLLFSIAFVAK